VLDKDMRDAVLKQERMRRRAGRKRCASHFSEAEYSRPVIEVAGTLLRVALLCHAEMANPVGLTIGGREIIQCRRFEGVILGERDEAYLRTGDRLRELLSYSEPTKDQVVWFRAHILITY